MTTLQSVGLTDSAVIGEESRAPRRGRQGKSGHNHCTLETETCKISTEAWHFHLQQKHEAHIKEEILSADSYGRSCTRSDRTRLGGFSDSLRSTTQPSDGCRTVSEGHDAFPALLLSRLQPTLPTPSSATAQL